MPQPPWPQIVFYEIKPTEDGLTFQQVAAAPTEYYASQIRGVLVKHAPRATSIVAVRGEMVSCHLGEGVPVKNAPIQSDAE
jgi:hypothetical protein